MSEDPGAELEIPDSLPLDFSLPLTGSTLVCNACGFESPGAPEFHEYGYVNLGCGKHFGYPQVTHLGPHICRHCPACGYSWPERIA